MPDYRKEEVRKAWMYDKAEDFVLRLTIGMIYAYFESAFLKDHQRQINPQERAEVMTHLLECRKSKRNSKGE